MKKIHNWFVNDYLAVSAALSEWTNGKFPKIGIILWCILLVPLGGCLWIILKLIQMMLYIKAQID